MVGGDDVVRGWTSLGDEADARPPEPSSNDSQSSAAWVLARGEGRATRMYAVIEGRLFAGAYPGHPEPPEHAARIESLWRAGVRTVISLMEENECTQHGQAFTPYVLDLQRLAATCQERVWCLRHPVRDLSIPSAETMRSILDTIDLSLDAGRPVYVHCYGGIGRTGTVIGCWLRRHGYATRADVLEVLATLRRTDVERASVTSPETAEQRRMVVGWAEREEGTASR